MDISKDLIERWKREFGNVYEYVAVTDLNGYSIYDEEGKIKEGERELKCYLHAPSLAVIDACKQTAGKSELKFNEVLVANCWIDGDKELKDVDEYRAGLYQWLGLLIRVVDGELKKL